jgi:TatA/E family protein of Tat protein translocase
MFGFGFGEMLVFALVVLLLFGKRLPATMRSLGVGIRGFREELNGGDSAALEDSRI